jgi:hypothetical protein
LIRYALGERPGLFLWRAHVRKKGDSRRRDSRYVVVLFLPFDEIDGLFVDFYRLWNAPLLRAPQSGDVSSLFIDLCDPDWPCASRISRAAGNGPAWLSNRFEELPDGDEQSVFSQVSQWFQSSETEFGNLAATFFPSRAGKGVRTELHYDVFPEVEEAEALRRAFPQSSIKGSVDPGVAERVLAVSDALSRRATEIPTFRRLAAYAKVFDKDSEPFSEIARKSEPLPPVQPDTNQSDDKVPIRRPFLGKGRPFALRLLSPSPNTELKRESSAKKPPLWVEVISDRWIRVIAVGLVIVAVFVGLLLFLAARNRSSQLVIPPEALETMTEADLNPQPVEDTQ